MTAILIIEDDMNLRREVASVLEYDGYTVLQAGDGVAGLVLAQQHMPDLILCDITLPELDGYGVLLELRAHPQTAAIPFIFLTAKVDRSDIRHGMELGADDYILKPFRLPQLRQAIQTRLEKREALTRIYEEAISSLRAELQSEHERLLAKSQFLSMIVHDLKSPLTTILSSASLLKDYEHRLTPERKQMKLERIEQTVREMVVLIDDLLLLGHSETDAFQLQVETIDLCDLCKNIIATLTNEMNFTHQIATHYEQCPQIEGDVKVLRRVIINLLTNAIKYSPHHSRITCKVINTDREVKLSVQDEGIGIPEGDQTKLFQLFQRSSNVGAIPGTGLGLAIIKRGVDLHNGRIDFTSASGKGTTFVITLPKQTQPVSVV